MIRYSVDTKLSDVVFREPSVITVLNRFNIFLGLGDKSIKEICEINSIDSVFFLTILNTYVNEDFFPESVLKTFSISKIIGYLKQTNSYYLQYHLPNIERHFDYLIKKSALNDNNLSLLKKFFNELNQELQSRIKFDSEEWFPNLLKHIEDNGSVLESADNTTSIDILEENYQIEDKLNDLKSFFIIHLQGEYDQNLCYAIINAIYTLEKDLKQNNRIRDRILKPLAISLK